MRAMRAARAWKAAIVFLVLITTSFSIGAVLILAPLNTVPVPEPANLLNFVKDKQAAIRLGKALFWDMQAGSDGVTACASCHFHAGADNRIRNQLNPGLLAGDETFQTGLIPGPDTTLTLPDFPFLKPVNPDNRGTGGVDPNDPAVLRNVNDTASSQGVVLQGFDAVTAGQSVDTGTVIPDTVFSRNGGNVRQVTPRNAPSVINAVFNFTQFWDGRANHYFNGVNPFGNMDVNATVWINQAEAGLQPLNLTANPTANPYLLDKASLASQATGPALSDIEMSWRGRSWPDLGRKMLSLRPLAKQDVHVRDSSLALLRDPSGKGLSATYTAMIQDAFRDELWNSTVPPPQTGTANYSQMESNFALFFGLAVQLYQATLVSDDTPFDRFMAGDSAAMTARQQRGLALFVAPETAFREAGGVACADCHTGAEFTSASVSLASNPIEAGPVEVMRMGDGTFAHYDLGFYNIGVRPTHEDVGRGGLAGGLPDLQGNPLPLSFSRQFALSQQGLLPFPPIAAPNCVDNGFEVFICPDNLLAITRIAVDGAFKTPGLRNVELTGPYMHDGSMATLMQVVEFYTRGGNFHEANIADLDLGVIDIDILKADPEKKREMVDFLLALTDERVRWEQAPFDHPQLFVPHGHGDPVVPGDPVLPDIMVEIPAVGDAGRQAQGLPPLKPFLAENLEGAALADFHFQHSVVNGTAPVIVSTPGLTAIQGKSYAYKVTASDAEGGPLAFTLDGAPAGMAVKTTSSFVAWISWFPTNAQVGTQAVTVRATDPTGLFTTQSWNIAVANANDRPLARNDAYAMIKGGTLNVAAPGVLANDSDPDAGDALTATNFGTPKAGTLTGNADGSFSYTPSPAYTGMDSFAYLARDNHGLASKTAGWVSIAVRANRAPLTAADAVATPLDTALVIDVLGNDSDPDTVIDPSNRIDPATVFIPLTGKPNSGGTVTVNADGTIGYTPAPGFAGIETFSYAVKDTYITPGISKAAVVSVTVQ